MPPATAHFPPPAEGLNQRLPRWYSRLLALAVLATVIYEVGFIGKITRELHWSTGLLVALFTLEHVINLRRSAHPRLYLREWGFHLGVAAVAVVLTLWLFIDPWLEGQGDKLAILTYGSIQGGMLLSLGLRAVRHQAQITGLNLRPGWLLMGSFLLIILMGTLLLKLPRAVVDGESISWVDAAFTSTSAVCVTGLSVENTALFFTPTGQVIILGLIQIGGLGIMTLTFYLSTMLLKGMSFHDRQILGEMISEKHLAQVADTVRFIVVFTFAVEALGAVGIFFSLPADGDVAERLFQSVFHSISAFCNAGFSTLKDNLADPSIRDLTGIQLVVCALIILGGIGAVVVRDVLAFGRQFFRRLRDPAQLRPRLRVHTRLVLTVTALLLFGGAFSLYVSEFWLHHGEANAGRWMTAFFHSVTARTAGFNTVDMGAIGPVTVHLLVLFMLIGGSPGGTAGGVRTTVFAAAAVHLWNLIRNTSDLVLFRRTMASDVGPRALAVLVLSMGWLFINFAILRQVQPDVSDAKLVFELVSAFATVGLSMNLTADLTEAAKWIIMLNMFVGRIGLITVVSTLIPPNTKRLAQRPTEEIILV